MGMEGPMGFFEAADFSQKQKHGGFQIVRSHTSRHQGMILVTLCNLLCDQYIVRLFGDLPKAQAYRAAPAGKARQAPGRASPSAAAQKAGSGGKLPHGVPGGQRSVLSHRCASAGRRGFHLAHRCAGRRLSGPKRTDADPFSRGLHPSLRSPAVPAGEPERRLPGSLHALCFRNHSV